MIHTHQMMGRGTLVFIGVILFLATLAAHGDTLDLNTGISHGQIIDDEFASQGVTVSADNVSGGPDFAVIFDSNSVQSTPPENLNDGDDDLRNPWTGGGNIDINENLGNLLIIPERGENDGGFLSDDPDDEGSRPAGSIMFEFNDTINSFGFDLVDIEGPVEFEQGTNVTGYFAAFHMGGTELAKISFGQFITPGDPFEQSGVAFGDNSANRIAPITIDDLIASFGLDSTIEGFDKVTIGLGGSGALTGVNFSRTPPTSVIPTPAALPAGLMLLGVAAMRRRRRK